MFIQLNMIDFFQKKTERVSVIVNKIHASIMHKCLVGEVTYIVPQTPAINLPLLNSHTVDFLVTYGYDVAPLLKRNNNIRFVCGLYSQIVSILAPDQSNILDLGDIIDRLIDGTISIAISNLQSKQCLDDLLNAYNLTKYKILVQSEEDIFQNYGSKYDIYFDVTMHPNLFFKLLTEKMPSHMVTINKINGGNYFVQMSEQSFYKKYPYYKKDMIDRISLTKYYRQISPPKISQHIQTIKSHLILLTHKDVSDDIIQTTLRKVVYQLHSNPLFKGLTPADIGYTGLMIPYHNGTNKIYKKLQLISVGNELNYYNGGL